ncbi:NAD(P)/FAD-dependent oxidoreductase, partial [Streptomyces sp. SID5998]|nr:NAD(P)/FAD-dependent oxidoreductase [Streptomyces sp. SID5998]
ELDALFGTAPAPPAPPTVAVTRPGDPALVPDPEHEAVTLTATVPAGGGDPAGHEALEARAERMIAAAERAVPGLRERILWQEVRGPADIERET